MQVTDWVWCYENPKKAAALIDHLRGLLDDKKYISIKADYNKGHLSYAGQLAARERKSLNNKSVDN